jgi:hypothetical protein
MRSSQIAQRQLFRENIQETNDHRTIIPARQALEHAIETYTRYKGNINSAIMLNTLPKTTPEALTKLLIFLSH